MRTKTNELESLLAGRGVPYYVTQERAADLTGIQRWRIRHAIDSRSMATAGDGCVTRHALAKWIAGQPAIVKRLRCESNAEPCLEWSADVMRRNETITVNA